MTSSSDYLCSISESEQIYQLNLHFNLKTDNYINSYNILSKRPSIRIKINKNQVFFDYPKVVVIIFIPLFKRLKVVVFFII